MAIDNHKVIKDLTGQEIVYALGRIRDTIAAGQTEVHHVYGFHIDSGESDPEDAVTYLADAIGIEPAYMDFTNGVFHWGGWREAFFMPRPCMLKFNGQVDYYLDENDYSQKAYGGGALFYDLLRLSSGED